MALKKTNPEIETPVVEETQPEHDLSMFKDDRFRGNIGKLPGCLLLNQMPKAGLFVKEKDAAAAGWTSTPGDGSEPYEHMFRTGETEQGYFLKSPRMNILLVSPRLIEVTIKGNEANPSYGKKGQLLANYDTELGYNLYSSTPKGYLTLRTFYLIQLLNAKNEFIHKLPIVMPVHGSAAASFGKALDQFCRLAESAYSDIYGNGQYLTLNEQARATLIFNPTFGVEMSGEGSSKSPICAVADYTKPTALDAAGVPSPKVLMNFFNMPKTKVLLGSQQSFAGFTARYLQQFEEYHPVEEGVNLALPSADNVYQLRSADPGTAGYLPPAA